MIRYLKKLACSDSPESSKRFVGLIGCFSLIIAMFIFHTDAIFYSVTILSGSSLAITGLESIFKKGE
jgi:hypothetical protein